MRAPWPGRLLGAARREPGLSLIVLLSAIAALLPIWIGRYVPLLDYPAHLANLFVWRHLAEPAWGFARHYTPNLLPLPYWVQYGTEYLLAAVAGEEAGQKLFLSLAVLGLPAALAVYARRLGRDPRLALFAFPLAWNMNTAHGFLAFIGGLPLLFLALAALDRHAERPAWGPGLLAALLGMLLYFAHILIWGAFLAVGGLTALIGPRPWSLRRALLAPLPTLPALGAGLLAYRYAQAGQAKLPLGSGGLSRFEGAFNHVPENLSMMVAWLIDLCPGATDEICLLLLALCWVLLLSARPLLPRAIAASPEGPRACRAELAVLVLLALYLLLPRSLLQPFYWFAINRRLAVAVALGAVLLVRGPIVGPRRILLLLAGITGIVYLLDLALHVRRFNLRAQGFDEVMDLVPRGKRVLPLMTAPGDPDVNVNCFNQWGSYVQLRQGGYMVPYFPVEFPLRHRGGLRAPAPAWDRPGGFDFAQHGAHWDYYLVHGPRDHQLFAGARERVRLLRRVGLWEIWRRLP